jgi:hypothetical protein
MNYIVQLDKNEDAQEVELQEQSRFIKSIIDALNFPISWNPDEHLTIEMKLSLRKQFDKFSIHILDDMNGGLKIYANSELLAEWKKPIYILKEDKNKRIYKEMNVSFWTSFEKGGNNKT